MADLLAVTLVEQIAEVKRELGQRRSVYPRLVASGSVSRARADRQVEIMEAVLTTLEHVAAMPVAQMVGR
jgi:hypothetical protein